jgi:hypothetical protein
MKLTKALAAAVSIASSLIACGQALAETKCVPLHDGVEYRAYLGDAKRFVYVDVKVLPGVFPSVFVIVDKNFDTQGAKIAANDPLNQWWIDRTQPMTFSTDTVRVRWQESHTFDFVTDWFSSRPPGEIAQAIRGLEKTGNAWQGSGAGDTNTFTFQTRIELSGFSGDYFEVSVPAITFDGATVTPPIVKFERVDKDIVAKC